MTQVTRVADKVGTLGAIVSAMGCAACFPAIASLGAAIGLGFLSQWEGLLVTYLIPLFALVALLANVIAWLRHRRWQRLVPGVAGPVLVLVGRYTFSSGVLYFGLAIMLATAIWDLLAPPHQRCELPNSETRKLPNG